MSKWNYVTVEPITSKKQPSCQTFVKLVKRITQNGLRILNKKGLYVIHQLLPDDGLFVHRMSEVFGLDLQRFTRHLHLAPVGGKQRSKYDWHANKAKPPNYSHLDLTVRFGVGKHRRHAALDEVNLAERAMRFLQNVVSLQSNPSQMRLQAIESVGGQMRQYPILDRQGLEQHEGIFISR